MTPFELFFGLTSVILGLALTQLANSLQLLLRAGRRVSWAPEPVLQAALVLMIVVFVWGDQWHSRSEAAFTVGQSIVQVLKLLALYVAAAAVLPEPAADGHVDLRAHYMRARGVTYGALIAGLMLFMAYRILFYWEASVLLNENLLETLAIPALYASLIAVRWRPYHLAALLFVCIAYGLQIAQVKIGG